MANGILQEVMQRADILSFDEKLTLAAYLIERAKQAAVNGPANSAKVNSQEQAAVEELQASADEPDPFRIREYEWLRQHREAYPGQYVALIGDQLVSHGPNLREVIDAARQSGYPRALFVRIESPDEPPFGGW